MARSAILITLFKVEFMVSFLVSTLSLIGYSLNFIGKQAKGMNVDSGRGGVDMFCIII